MAQGTPLADVEAVIIGGSAGSLDVLLSVLPDVQPDINFAIIVVLHRKRVHNTWLHELFATRTRMPVYEVEEKQPVLPGTVYIAPADYHLLFEKDRSFSLDYSEMVNYSRPSIDVAFESAAHVYGQNLAALLLSGANADGVCGLRAVVEYGGMALIQDPETASVSYMPAQAALAVELTATLHTHEIADYLNRLSKRTGYKHEK